MTRNPVRRRMEVEQEQIHRMLRQARTMLTSGIRPLAQMLLARFQEEFKDHATMEETRLFPRYADVDGDSLEPLAVLREQYREIRERLGAAIRAVDEGECMHACAHEIQVLERILHEHFRYAGRTLYVVAEKLASGRRRWE